MTFLRNKKILNVRSKDYFFRSDHFLTAVILLHQYFGICCPININTTLWSGKLENV